MKIATLCYIKNKGKTLLIRRTRRKRSLFSGKWNGLGGKLQAGESLEDCVIREIKQESGLFIREPIFKGVLHFPNNLGTDEAWFVFVYVASTYDGKLEKSPEGKVAWIKDRKIKDLDLLPANHYFMPWLDKDVTFSAKFIFNREELTYSSVFFY